MVCTTGGHRVTSKKPVPELVEYEGPFPEPHFVKDDQDDDDQDDDDKDGEDEWWFPETKVELSYKDFMKRKDVIEHYPKYKDRQAAWKEYKEWLEEDDEE